MSVHAIVPAEAFHEWLGREAGPESVSPARSVCTWCRRCHQLLPCTCSFMTWHCPSGWCTIRLVLVHWPPGWCCYVLLRDMALPMSCCRVLAPTWRGTAHQAGALSGWCWCTAHKAGATMCLLLRDVAQPIRLLPRRRLVHRSSSSSLLPVCTMHYFSITVACMRHSLFLRFNRMHVPFAVSPLPLRVCTIHCFSINMSAMRGLTAPWLLMSSKFLVPVFFLMQSFSTWHTF